ncbi:MAG: hypothetical protein H7210_13335 [Pyrinomonadaceae bacterium]|nr:hypothetical protein [Phycisphaerales bacterium]
MRPVGGEQGPAPRNTGDRITDIAFDADVEYYNSLGSNVANVVNDIESLMNGIEGIYENNTDISYEQTTIIVRTAEPDPYTSTNPGTLLGQLDTHWSGSLSSVRRDVAHLMTGKNVDGGVIGIAFLSGICSTGSGYGLSQSRYTSNVTLRRSLTAHELGHNWSAQHCDGSGSCNIMCSCNGCGPPDCTGNFTSFGAGEATQIINFRNSRSCLITEPAPVVPPFFDDFPISTIDLNKWVYIDGASVSTGSINPPSPTRAVQLNATAAGAYDDDDLRSHFINMVGVTNPQLTYFVEARGVPSGKQLFVDVWTSSLRWVNVNTIVSDGVDDSAFTQYTTALTGVSGAAHAEFRVRFRPDVDSSSQNWYIDNVYVGAPQGPPTGACCLAGGTCVSDTAAGCATQGGNYQGDNTACGNVECPQPPGACCLDTGGCVTTLNLGLCLALHGVWQGAGTTCANAGCPEPIGACCLPDGSCSDVADEAACNALGGKFQGAGVLCEQTSCPLPTGACCLDDGSCITADAATCTAQSGTFNGAGSLCVNVTCPQPSGACCLPSGVCIETDEDNCLGQSGVFNGVGSLCVNFTCPQPVGACCLASGECVETDQNGCTAQGGTFSGVGSTCAATKCAQPCGCDWNNSGDLSSQDFFDFISAFFSDNGDFNMDGVTTSQDFFDFIACFFSGC